MEIDPLIWFAFQPPAHLLDRKMVWYTLLNGGRIGVVSENVSHVLDDIMALRPTIIISTPRFFNFVYTECKEIAFDKKEKEDLSDEEMQHVLKEEFVKRFGGRVKSINATAAAVSDEMLEFLRKSFDCLVGSTLGSTEADNITSPLG